MIEPDRGQRADVRDVRLDLTDHPLEVRRARRDLDELAWSVPACLARIDVGAEPEVKRPLEDDDVLGPEMVVRPVSL